MNEIHLVGNAHIDIFWLWRWEEGLQEIRATFASALDRIQEHNDFIFTSACAYYYQLVEETDPGLFERIREQVKAGRWRVVGGWWLQPDCNAPAGESYARQGLYGQRYFKEKFGLLAETGYNVDSFGHNGNLPQLLKKCGLKNYVFMRPMAHEKNLSASLFQWEGIDGSRVTAHRLPMSYNSGSDWGDRLIEKIEAHVRFAEKEGTPLMCFYGVGNHGGGPTVRNLETIDKLKAGGKNITYSDPDNYFKNVSGLKNTPVIKDELQYHAIGCYSVLSKVKRANNSAEQQLLAAEKMLAVLGNSGDGEKHRALSDGWKKVLTNQFHDSLGGCSIPEAYPKILAAYGWAQETANHMTALLFQRLASKIDTSGSDSTAVVWNPHPWELRQSIEILGTAEAIFDADGGELPFEPVPTSAVTHGFFSHAMRLNIMLPALGYTGLRLVRHKTSVDSGSFNKYQYTRTASNHITSGDWDAVIDRESGFITSLKNIRTNTEYLGGEGIGPFIIDDESDTWTHAISSYRGAARKMTLESYTLVSEGAVSTEYEIVYKLFDSAVILRVILNGGLGTLDIKTRVLWNEKHRLLKLRVGSAFGGETFVSEIPYGSIERCADGTEWPIQRWACLGDPERGLAVINDGVYSASAENGALDLTLLRSPVYSHHEPQHPRPDIHHRYVDQGEAEFLVQLRPMAPGGTLDDICRYALELNQSAVYVIESAHPGAFPPEQSFCGTRSTDGKKSSVLITAIKRSEDNDGWIIRAVESAGKNVSAQIDFSWLDASGTFSFVPFEIKTIKIVDGNKTPKETDILEF